MAGPARGSEGAGPLGASSVCVCRVGREPCGARGRRSVLFRGESRASRRGWQLPSPREGARATVAVGEGEGTGNAHSAVPRLLGEPEGGRPVWFPFLAGCRLCLNLVFVLKWMWIPYSAGLSLAFGDVR